MRILAIGLLALWLAACASALRWEGGPRDSHYEVRQGDTLYSIAVRHDLDYRDLARWNDIGGSYLIRPGQTLRLHPPDGEAATRTASRGPITDTPSRPRSQQETVRRTPPARDSSQDAIADWAWPVSGEVLRRFGPPDSKGINIGAPQGSKVRAAAPGRVVYSGSALRGYGELIIVKHNESFLSAYGYNRRRLAEEGDEVAAGDVIGEVGTGPEQKSMLHFEIREAGQPVDPLRLLPADG